MGSLQEWFTEKDRAKVERSVKSKIYSLALISGETPCILSGGDDGVLLHRPKDQSAELIGSQTRVLAVAVSADTKWIVAGMTDGITIWKNTQSGRDSFKIHHDRGVRTIDISSDSKWVVTGSDNRTANVWDLATGQQRPGIRPIKHEYNVTTVKFCPCGERIVTATLFGSVRIYDSCSGKRLLTIPVTVRSVHNTPNITLAWFANRPQILAVSNERIECRDSEKGSLVFQWPVRGVVHPPSIALSPNNKIIAYSSNDMVILWDATTRKQIDSTLPFQHEGNVSCIAFSSGGDCLVVGVESKSIIWRLRGLLRDSSLFDLPAEPTELCVYHKRDNVSGSSLAGLSLPLMNITHTAVRPWLYGFLKDAEEAFSTEIAMLPNYNAFANRALVRVQMGKECAMMALEDAEKSLDIQKSAIGWIAKILAIIQQEKYEMAREAIIWLEDYKSPSDPCKLILEITQDILLCLCGKKVSHKIDMKKHQNQKDQILLLLVQANIYLLQNEFGLAVESFKDAGVPTMFTCDETSEMQTLSYIFGWKFSGLDIQIHQKHCEFLLDQGNPEVINLFLRMKSDYEREFTKYTAFSKWAIAFRDNCLMRLEDCGDKSLKLKDYEKAIKQYKAGESLTDKPESKHNLLLKQSQVHAETERWEESLQDAIKAIKVDESSPWSYEKKFGALYALTDYKDAAKALDKMVSLLKSSQDRKSIDLRKQGVRPDETKESVMKVVQQVLAQPRPHILINTKSGRLCNKQKQIEAFMANPEYKDLLLSRTSEGRIEEVVRHYFRFATLSHTWEDNGEPQFDDVENGSVVNLVESFPNMKLKTFCKKTREHGYQWAWSDTCCINKAQKDVLDMSLRSMYRWYSESSLTIVHLKGVLHQLEIDGKMFWDILDEFVKCRWNGRAWTLQEYFASRVIHFYTQDWEPYLPISHMDPRNPINHKNCDAIQQGMERVTGLHRDRLSALRPGSGDARLKLSLASARKATRDEDIAYALLGIFKITIPTIYGDDEAPRALGRLLEALLTQSAEVAILAWTGTPSEYNTCLPTELTVYQEPESRYIPNLMVEEAAPSTSALNMPLSSSVTDIHPAVKLHDNLIGLPYPKLHHGRLELPCILFQAILTPDSSSITYTVRASFLNDVVLNATEDLSNVRNPVLVHPWFSYLLDPNNPRSDSARRKAASRLFAALKLPFGALLLSLDNTYRSYQRVATDQFIRAQIRDDVTPEQLLDNISVLHVR